MMTVPLSPRYDSVTDSSNGNGVEKAASRTPVLAHRMKHDKSILALVVSAEYIFAGTQGGEILVRPMRKLGA
jgi:di- and tripeptidase